jgi:uncharacterized metal-binding protein YceD (DUF177 family)
MSQPTPSDSAFRVADLAQNRASAFKIRPNAEVLRSIAETLGLSAIRKLRFEGVVEAVGKTDWRLKGKLGATVVQPCTVTLEPVLTRIDAPVERMFLKNIPEIMEEEIEMPEEEGIEVLGPYIDPEFVMLEALSLEVPDFPRADGAALDRTVFTAPGQAPMTDEDARPFAGLAALKDQLEQKPE